MLFPMRHLVMKSWLDRSPDELFPFFSDASNLSRITPPELAFRILSPTPIPMAAGALIDYRIGLFGVPMRWRTRIASWDPPRSFSDEQLRGPYRVWHHVHRFDPLPDGGTLMTDDVAFQLPLEPFSRLVRPLIELQLRRIFRYRDQALQKALGLHPTRPSELVFIDGD